MTPFLKGFPTLLYGSAKRKMRDMMQAGRDEMRNGNCGPLSSQLAEEIPAKLVSRNSSTVRARVYSHEVTFWAFLSQVLSEDGSCAYAVAQVQQWMRGAGLPIPSSDTSSYVAARQALRPEMLKAIHADLSTKLDQNLSSEQLWRGHRVLAIDATSVQLPDTAENQAAFPQPSGQSPGCGFPVAQLVGLINLCHGGLIDLAVTPLRTSELRGFDELEHLLNQGDILTGDRLYSSYEVVARVQELGAEYIGRPHSARQLDFRKGEKIGPNERIQVWQKPRMSVWCKLTREQWDELPNEISVRIIRTKGPDRKGKRTTRYVVTTLLDSVKYPAEEIASIYVHRWDIELRFRDIKTTMGMELLRTKTPQMALKEIMMYGIAYNVVRLLMLKAAAIHHCSHRRIGFKGVLQVIDTCRASFEKMAGKPRLAKQEKANLMPRRLTL